PAHARAVARIGLRQVAATGMAGALEDQVHERTTPQASAAGGMGADVFASIGYQRVAGHAAESRVRMRLRQCACGCDIPTAMMTAAAGRLARRGSRPGSRR